MIERGVLVLPPEREEGAGGGGGLFFGTEVMRLPDLEKGVVGVAGLAVCQDNQGFAEFLESFGVEFGDEAAGELGVCATDRLLSR